MAFLLKKKILKNRKVVIVVENYIFNELDSKNFTVILCSYGINKLDVVINKRKRERKKCLTISNQNIIQIIKYMLTKNNKMKRWLWQSDKIGVAMELGNVCVIFQYSRNL